MARVSSDIRQHRIGIDRNRSTDLSVSQASEHKSTAAALKTFGKYIAALKSRARQICLQNRASRQMCVSFLAAVYEAGGQHSLLSEAPLGSLEIIDYLPPIYDLKISSG